MSRVGFGLLLLVVIAVLSQDMVRAAAPLRSVVRVDAYGDPLPPGAIARMGSVRFLHPSCRRLEFSPDGKKLISNDGLRRIVWDAHSGRELSRTERPVGSEVPRDPTANLAVNWVCSDEWVWSIHLVDAKTNKVRHVLPAPTHHRHVAVLSSDEKLLAVPEVRPEKDDDTKEIDLAVHIWDTRTGKRVAKLPGHGPSDFRIAFIPGTHLLFVNPYQQPKLWDIDTGKVYLEFGKGDVSWLTGNKQTVVVQRDGDAVQLWDLKKRTVKQQIVLPKVPSAMGTREQDWQSAGALSGDEGKLALASWTGHITIRDLRTGHVTGHRGERFPPDEIDVASDGKHVLGVWDLRSRMRVFEADTGKERFCHQSKGAIEQARLLKDGSSVLMVERVLPEKGDLTWVLSRYDFQKQQEVWRVEYEGMKCRLVVSKDETRLGVALITWDVSHPGDARVLDARTGEEAWKSEVNPVREVPLALDDTGKYLAVSELDRVTVFDTTTGKVQFTTKAEDMRFLRLQFTSGPPYLIGRGSLRDKGGFTPNLTILRVWNCLDGKEHLALGDKLELASADTCHAGGNLVFVYRHKRGALLGSTETWDVLARKQQAIHPKLSLSSQMRFLPELNCFLGLSTRAGIQLHEIDTGISLWNYSAMWSGLHRASVFPDDRRVLFALNTGAMVVQDLLSDGDPGWEQQGKQPRFGRDQVTLYFTTMCALVRRPEELLELAREELKREPPRPKDRIAQAIRDLDADEAAVRKAAKTYLETLGPLAGPELELAQASPSLEVRRSVKYLLNQSTNRPPKDQELRHLRLMRLLAYTRVPGGDVLLREIALGEPLGYRTKEAKRLLALPKSPDGK